ncbi:hypothetical protein BUE80_DR005537 [Diplocarpon rosae]|nr:hypothetical protein BUE80_DR005537 [Diplocarpon rosae]
MTTIPPTSPSPSPSEPKDQSYTSKFSPPLPVPTHGVGGSFSVLASTFIPNSRPSEVLSTIRNTSTWKEWNGFTPIFTFKPISSPSPPTPPPSDPDIPTGNEGWLELGTRGDMDVFMSGDGLQAGVERSRAQGMEVSVLEAIRGDGDAKKGFRIAWVGVGYAHWQLRTERVTELTEDEQHGVVGTRYVCWETFAGVMAPIVKWTVGASLVSRFGEYAGGLRAYCARGAGEGVSESEGAAEGRDVALDG